MVLNIAIFRTVMRIIGSRQQCCCKCHPMWDLRGEKIAAVRFPISVVFIFTSYTT